MKILAMFLAGGNGSRLHPLTMDVRQMVCFHQERGAEVSVAAVPVTLAQASAFGIMAVGAATELHEFQENPERPTPMPKDPDRAYAYEIACGGCVVN